MTWRIHTIINPETGEIRPFGLDAAPNIEEFQQLAKAISRRQAALGLAALRPHRPPLKAAAPPEAGEALALHFFGPAAE